MSNDPNCPKCNSANTYSDGNMWICPECAHEWIPVAESEAPDNEPIDNTVRDSNGVALTSGDSVSVIKDLKVKGSSSVVKSGTKVRNIRIIEDDDGHNIACKIDGIGAMNLKSEFVKKV